MTITFNGITMTTLDSYAKEFQLSKKDKGKLEKAIVTLSKKVNEGTMSEISLLSLFKLLDNFPIVTNGKNGAKGNAQFIIDYWGHSNYGIVVKLPFVNDNDTIGITYRHDIWKEGQLERRA